MAKALGCLDVGQSLGEPLAGNHNGEVLIRDQGGIAGGVAGRTPALLTACGYREHSPLDGLLEGGYGLEGTQPQLSPVRALDI